MRFSQLHVHPVLLLCLMVLWGAASLYLFTTGTAELIQINHEMSEALEKGRTALIREQTPPIQIHITWRLVLGTVLLGLAMGLFRWHNRRGREL
jgi:hypothetical protein